MSATGSPGLDPLVVRHGLLMPSIVKCVFVNMSSTTDCMCLESPAVALSLLAVAMACAISVSAVPCCSMTLAKAALDEGNSVKACLSTM